MTRRDQEDDDDEEIVGYVGANAPGPVIGSVIVMMGNLYRCISVEYAEAAENRHGKAEIRVRYKEEGTVHEARSR